MVKSKELSIAYVGEKEISDKLASIYDYIVRMGHRPVYFNNISQCLREEANVGPFTVIVVDSYQIHTTSDSSSLEEWLHTTTQPVIVVGELEPRFIDDVIHLQEEGLILFVDDTISYSAFVSAFYMIVTRTSLVKDSFTPVEDSHKPILQKVIDALPDLVWLKDLDGVYMTCNRRFEEFYGDSQNSIIGKTDYDYTPKAIADIFRENDLKALSAGGPCSNEETLQFKSDDHVEIVETIKTPIYDSDTNPIGVLGVARDITQRKQNEMSVVEMNTVLEERVEKRTEDLKIMTERLSLATQAGRLGTWDWDVKEQSMWWDTMGYEIFGMVKDPSLNLIDAWLHRIHPKDKDRIEKAINDDILNKNSINNHYRVTLDDGNERYINTLGSILRDEKGKAYRVVGINLDESEEIKFQNYLREAKEQAESASEAKTQFIANMSHEIRTPINTIIGMNYLMSTTELTDRQKDFNDKIYHSSEQLLNIVTDILDFSKIEAGEMKLEKIRFIVKKVMENVFNMHHHSAKGKGLSYRLHVDKNIPEELIGDPLRLEQTLSNLINNAIKFTKKGTVQMNVHYIGEVDGKVHLKFSVMDTGIGLTKEHKKKLFTAFQQADTSTTRHYGGTGLGLIISQQIVKMMGGEIQVSSKWEKGSTFEFELPFEICSDNKRIKPKSVEIPMLRQGLKVLLVEDNEVNQQLTSEILTERGAEVQVGRNGKDAIDILKKGYKVDIILMDIHMPEMDGIEATEYIRQMKNYQMIPIIGLTADVTEEGRVSIMTAGMNEFLAKPVHVWKLIETVKKWDKG